MARGSRRLWSGAPALWDDSPARGVLGRPEKPRWPSNQAEWDKLYRSHSPSYWAALWAPEAEPPADPPLTPEEEEQLASY